MSVFIIILFIILGLIVGSFLGVVVARIGTGKGLGGRSQCLSCNRKLSWYELIPLVSYLSQEGKCRKCKTPIPRQDFYIEIVTGILFGWIGALYTSGAFEGSVWMGIPVVIVWLVIISLSVAISFYDFGHKSIPVALLYPLIILLFVVGLFRIPGETIVLIGNAVTWPTVLHTFGGAVVALPFFVLWLISRGAWIGFGDIELMMAMGFVLPSIGHSITSVVVGFWIGAIAVAILILLKLCGITVKVDKQIPFAPFLLLSLIIIGTTGLNLFGILFI